MKSSNTKVYGIIACLVLLSFPLWLTPEGIAFKSDAHKEIIPTLGFLFIIALFMERAIEVFLSAWRATGADLQDLEIDKCTKSIERAETKLEISGLSSPEIKETKEELSNLNRELLDLNNKRTKYRAKSRELALWFGLVLGILISSVGVRALSNFIDKVMLDTIEGTRQGHALKIVDVLLTGSLLSGGSEAINKLAKIYTNFTQATAERAKGKGNP